MSFPRLSSAICAGLLAVGLGPAAAADLSAEERLEAVRQELVQATLQGSTQVQSTAWVDASGALREASSFRHGMQVRGVRVMAYQRDAAGQPQAQVQWQGREDTVRAAASSPASPQPQACVPEARLKHVLGLSLVLPPQRSDKDGHLITEASRALVQGWGSAAESAAHWRLLDQPLPAVQRAVAPGTPAAYHRLLTAGPVSALPSWVASLRLEPVPSAGGWGTWLGWWEAPAPRLRLSLSVAPSEGGAALFQAETELPLQVHTPNWAPPRLAPASQADLRAVVGQWSQALGQRLACQPVKVQVLQSQADRVEVDQGRLAGLRVGDEWLISDRQRVPQRLLEPGAAAAVVLARVERVEAQRAELKVLAGPAEQVRAQWQAWPVLAQ